jgi:hypothetical protein
MAIAKKEKIVAQKPKTETLWRKPITLDVEDDKDPLATLYRGREASETVIGVEIPTEPVEGKAEKISKKPIVKKAEEKLIEPVINAPVEIIEKNVAVTTPDSDVLRIPRISDSGLKNVLRIKSETFTFTDIREILRGKSIDIYAYLLMLSGEKGSCKIKHLDMMRALDISRPTLFKQGEWLTKLALIEKSSVPGDHFGTSYNVFPIENSLPVGASLFEQFNVYFEEFRQTFETQ